jgi:hypothetical protein
MFLTTESPVVSVGLLWLIQQVCRLSSVLIDSNDRKNKWRQKLASFVFDVVSDQFRSLLKSLTAET